MNKSQTSYITNLKRRPLHDACCLHACNGRQKLLVKYMSKTISLLYHNLLSVLNIQTLCRLLCTEVSTSEIVVICNVVGC